MQYKAISYSIVVATPLRNSVQLEIGVQIKSHLNTPAPNWNVVCDFPVMGDIDIQDIVFAGSVVLLAASLLIIHAKYQVKSGYKNPPGPRGLPILGNALQVPEQVSRYQFVGRPKSCSFDCLLAHRGVLSRTYPDVRRACIIESGRNCAFSIFPHR